MNKRLRYLRDRIANASSMVRTGDWRAFVRAIFTEFGHRVEAARSWWHRRRQLDFSKIPTSIYVDRRRRVPPSPCPTRQRRAEPPVLQLDAGALRDELDSILAGIRIPESSGE